MGEQARAVEPARHLLTLSAPSADGMRVEVAGWLASGVDEAGFVVACTASNAAAPTGKHRLAISAATLAEATSKLKAYLEGRRETGLYEGDVLTPRPRVAFLFTGQGSQYTGMGRELYEAQPVFRDTLRACVATAADVLPLSLDDVMFGRAPDASLIDQTLYTQPALFALEYALAELLSSWGICADLVMGHSVGEYVAACRAGVFSFADGMALIAARARLMQSLPTGGKMAAIATSAAAVAAMVEPYASEVSIAAINGDDAVVLSGAGERVSTIAAELTARGIKVTMLTVSHAFHSPLVEPILDAFTKVAATIHFSSPKLELVSNVTGEIAGDNVCTPQYWRGHVREAVRFASGLRTAYARGCRVFVELGPNPVLLGMARSLLPTDVVMVPTLRRRRSDWQQLQDCVAELYVRGIDFDGPAFAVAR